MRVAVTYDVETGEIFQHFGHTEAFKIYDIEGGAIVNQMVVTTGGQGHEALANFLTRGKVEALICGGIGAGAQLALSDAGIRLFPGVEGSADDAANSFASGNIVPCFLTIFSMNYSGESRSFQPLDNKLVQQN